METPRVFLKEFCTLRLSLPRRLGNTTLCWMLMERYKNALCVTLNQDLLNQILAGNPRKYDGVYLTWNQVIRETRMSKLDLVVVDCASLVERLDDIYESTQASFYVFIS